MDWIKIKTKHVFYEGFNKTTQWAWIRILSLTAQLEAIPNESQMLSVVTKREFEALAKHFSKCGQSILKVVSKCHEDCLKVIEERERKKRERKNKFISIKPKTPISSADAPRTIHGVADVDKIRGDKIREDKNTPLPPKGENNILSYLLIQWKTKNPLEAKHPKLLDAAERGISAALVRGENPSVLEKLIWDTAGQGIVPWELFAVKKKNPMDDAQKTLKKMEAMGL